MNGQAIVDLLGRLFPSFASMPEEARRKRAEGLARYVAQTWVAGPDGLRQRGIEVPDQVHAALLPDSPGAKQSPGAALEFLSTLRGQLSDDPAFAKILTAYAQVYAASLQAGRPSSMETVSRESLEDSRADEGGLDLAPSPQAAPAQPASLEDSRADEGLDIAPSGSGGDDDLDFAPSGAGLGSAGPGRAPVVGGGVVIQSSGGDSGGLDLADDDAPPARRAPVAGAGVTIASSGGDSGGLDLADDDSPRTAPTPTRAAAPATPSGGAGDGLGLLDVVDEEPEPEERPSLEELLYSAEAPAPAPPADEPQEVSTMTLREKLEGKKPRARPKPPSDSLAAGRIPKDPAQKAIHFFERTGDAGYLGTAVRLLEAQLEQAPHDTAAAVAAAEIARVSILQGDVAGANRYAKIAQSKDPANPMAAEVLVRLGRGEAQRAGFRRQVAEARHWLIERNFAEAKPAIEALVEGHSSLPHGFLMAAFMAKLAEDEKGFQRNLAEAWRRYPPREQGEVPLGGGLDADVVDLLVNHGRAVFRGDDAEALKQTIENIDHKENLIAGALRMAVALAKVALIAGGLTEEQERRLTFSIGRGLVGLQYYDAAMPWFGKASCLNPTEADTKAIHAERANTGALRRAFDRPGIKAQLKGYRCLASELLARDLQQRLEAVATDRDRYEEQLRAQASRLAAVAKKDARVRQELEAAATQASITNPLAPVDAAEDELHAVARERALAKAEAKNLSKSSGLFATLKGAASKVSGAARETKLKFQENQATQKHKAAVKAMVELITGSLGDLGWKQIALKEFVRRAAVAEAFSDYLDSEERRIQEQLARLAEFK